MGRIMTQNGTKIRENFKHPAMQASSTIFLYAGFGTFWRQLRLETKIELNRA
jgi:hypothetical protein